MNTNSQRVDIGESAVAVSQTSGRQQVRGAQWGGKTAGPLPGANHSSNGASPRSQRRHRSSAVHQVRTMRTRDLKLHISILEAQIRRADNGQESFDQEVLVGMRARLQLMRDEKSARDVRDLGRGRKIPGLSAFSLGARASIRVG